MTRPPQLRSVSWVPGLGQSTNENPGSDERHGATSVDERYRDSQTTSTSMLLASILSATTRGPSIKYVTLFLANFDPPSPCRTLSHIPGSPKVRHTSQNPPIFSRPSTKS